MAKRKNINLHHYKKKLLDTYAYAAAHIFAEWLAVLAADREAPCRKHIFFSAATYDYLGTYGLPQGLHRSGEWVQSSGQFGR